MIPKEILDTLNTQKVLDYIKNIQDQSTSTEELEILGDTALPWAGNPADFVGKFQETFYIRIFIGGRPDKLTYDKYVIEVFKKVGLGFKYEEVINKEVESGNQDDCYRSLVDDVLKLYSEGKLKFR